ncbi:MAG: hypothetical protein JST84_04625 [Acidobacteria bacterium]|nr:hypothetical protein [Acidobacteriota bacterium]
MTLSILALPAAASNVWELTLSLPDKVTISVKDDRVSVKRAGGSRIESRLTEKEKAALKTITISSQTTTGRHQLRVNNSTIRFNQLSELPIPLQELIQTLTAIYNRTYYDYRRFT